MFVEKSIKMKKRGDFGRVLGSSGERERRRPLRIREVNF
jgi:hypothetical protein